MAEKELSIHIDTGYTTTEIANMMIEQDYYPPLYMMRHAFMDFFRAEREAGTLTNGTVETLYLHFEDDVLDEYHRLERERRDPVT